MYYSMEIFQKNTSKVSQAILLSLRFTFIEVVYKKESENWFNLYKQLRSSVPLFYKNTIIYPELDLRTKSCNRPTKPLPNSLYETAEEFLPIDKQMGHICKMLDRYLGNLFSSIANFAELKYFVNEGIFQILKTDKNFMGLYNNSNEFLVNSSNLTESNRAKRIATFKQLNSLIEQELTKKIFLNSIGV